MLDELVNEASPLWGAAPGMALVMLASVPSGVNSIVEARARVRKLMFTPVDHQSCHWVAPTLRHVIGPFHSFPSPLLYIGTGSSDIQGRPSQWANPFSFFVGDAESAFSLFTRYLESRADLLEFLTPLSGADMICDCKLGSWCHGHELTRTFQEKFLSESVVDTASSKLDAMSASCVMEGFDDDDDEGLVAAATDGEVMPAPKFNEKIEAINETIRGSAANIREERPNWLPTWVTLIAMIRGAIYPVFWEMFAGKAGLTREFLRQGWPCGPPVDVVYNPDFDLLNPFFLTIVLGLIFERLIRVLHLGPPCSSFSMACNRFKSYAMRSAQEPAGFANQIPHRAQKVRLGNALADISAKLAEAQEKAMNFWMLEQPTTSLMWLYGPIAELISKFSTFLVTVDVCMFGAPWMKPTSLASNFPGLLKLARKCDRSHTHISLQGNAPCGKSWTAIASPYWPAFAREWVIHCASLFLAEFTARMPPLHFAGFPYVSGDVSVESLLIDMGFKPSGHTDVATVATRVTAGVQPTGRSMPQLLPDGLGPDDHLTVAKSIVHPFARPPSLPGYVHRALNAQRDLPSDLATSRSLILAELRILAKACTEENARIIERVHPYIRPIVAKRNIAFMREVSFICQGLDYNLMIDYVFGLPMLGWARHSPIMLQRQSQPPRAVPPSSAQIIEENKIALSKAKPSYSHALDKLAWEKTQKEFENFSMLGPFYSLDELPDGKPRLLNRFGILEMHGGAIEESCRVIDDGRSRGHNADSANTAAHRPADLDLLAAVCRLLAFLFPNQALAGFPSDFKSAYRQVPSDPRQALDFVIASWDTDNIKQVFFLAVSQVFGSGNAPLNFTRYADFCCRVLAGLFAIPAVHCVDDIIVFELLKSVMSAFECWRCFADLCGWDVPDAKSPPPSQSFRGLGAIIDLSQYPAGPLLFRPAEDRINDLILTLQKVSEEHKLSPALAGKLYGKLMFMSSQYFGRLGRALLRAFSRRQHEVRFAFNPQIIAAIAFWIRNMRTLRPREIPTALHLAPLYLSYSDGEGDKAGVGVALWCPGGKVVGGYMQIPEIVREVWSRSATCGEHYDIFEIEAVGPLLVLHNFGYLIPEGALWIHFIDNDAALATLVKGSSSVLSGEVITAHTHSLIAERGVWPWFDRVASKDNPVDQLSRGKLQGPWQLKEIEVPPKLVSELQDYLDSNI